MPVLQVAEAREKVAALGFSVDTTVHWVRANRFAAGFDEVASVPEPGSRVLFILALPWRDPSPSAARVCARIPKPGPDSSSCGSRAVPAPGTP